MACLIEVFGPPRGKKWDVQQGQSQVAQYSWSDPYNVRVPTPGPGQAGMRRTELPGSRKWVTSWEDCGSQVASVVSPWELAVVGRGVVRSRMMAGGSRQKTLEAGSVRGVRGWIQSPAEGYSICSFFPQLGYLYVFLFSKLKTLIMALDRFTCFYFFLQRGGNPGSQSQPSSYFQQSMHGSASILFVLVFLLGFPSPTAHWNAISMEEELGHLPLCPLCTAVSDTSFALNNMLGEWFDAFCTWTF